MAKTKTKGAAKTVSDTPAPQPITISSTNPKIMADNIKKLEKAIKGADDASEISYDNTESHLTASNVQAAIDEVVTEIGSITSPAASDVTYDNTSSGLTADDVQDAIDEVNGKITNVSVVSTTTVTTSQDDSATLTLLSNGVKVLNYNGAHFPATETTDILTIPSGYTPVITSNIYSVGSTDQGKPRMIKIANNKLSAYAQPDSDTGLYITVIYI